MPWRAGQSKSRGRPAMALLLVTAFLFRSQASRELVPSPWFPFWPVRGGDARRIAARLNQPEGIRVEDPGPG
jgi:hypothetical protein